MKKTLFAISAIAVLLGFTACTSENETLEPQVSGKTITLKAYTEEATRTALDGNDTDGYKVVWETGDEIKIGENTFTLTDGEETTSGTFTGAALTDGTEYTAYYPVDYDGTNWPTAQTYTAGNITGSPMSATFTYATGDEPSLSFKNEGGILRLNLTGEAKVTSIKISATNLTNPITLDCGSTGVGLSTTTATPFHIAVPGADEGTAYSGLKIVITDDAGLVCTKTAKSAITVMRSQITNVNLSASTFYPNYLCFTAEEDGATISMAIEGTPTTLPTLEYSTDLSSSDAWTPFTPGSTDPITLNKGKKVYFRGENPEGFNKDYYNYVYFTIPQTVAASGNVMSLIDPTCQTTTIPYEGCFSCLFDGCTGLTTAPELPATSLADYCYYCMFSNCTGLTTAPELPATTLTEGCYSDMFYGCTGLTTATELPATKLKDYCYHRMFFGCESLTTAPALPATTLADGCYSDMFYGCTSLTTAPALPATTLADECYYEMFCYCSSLTTAPELKATTLTDYCYEGMFYGCSSLNSVTCLATDISAEGCVDEWLDGTAASGTLYCAPGMKEEFAVEGWTIVDPAPAGSIGKATRTGDIDVKWVQLWKDGLKWAEYNVGATNNKAEDYGGYFSWANNIAETQWGENWRMPTKADFEALLANCTCTWTSQNSVNGLLCTGKDAYASNSIFLPAAGANNGGAQGVKLNYWSSTEYDSSKSYFLFVTSSSKKVDWSTNGYTMSVRAVLAK